MTTYRDPAIEKHKKEEVLKQTSARVLLAREDSRAFITWYCSKIRNKLKEVEGLLTTLEETLKEASEK